MAIREITVDELADRRGSGVFLLDVRTPEEYAEVRVPGAVLIPLAELSARFDDLPEGVPVDVICRSGARSASAVEMLVARGVDAVNVAGGTSAWVRSGRAVDSGPPGAEVG